MPNILALIYMELQKMAISLDALTAEMAKNTDTSGKVIALLQKLVAEITAIPASTDPVTQAALDTLTATLTANDAAIAAEVTKSSTV